MSREFEQISLKPGFMKHIFHSLVDTILLEMEQKEMKMVIIG